MSWVGRYQDTCRDLGIEDDKLDFPKGRGLTMLIDKYIDRIHQTLKTWFTNILEVSFAATCSQAQLPKAIFFATVRHAACTHAQSMLNEYEGQIHGK